MDKTTKTKQLIGNTTVQKQQKLLLYVLLYFLFFSRSYLFMQIVFINYFFIPVSLHCHPPVLHAIIFLPSFHGNPSLPTLHLNPSTLNLPILFSIYSFYFRLKVHCMGEWEPRMGPSSSSNKGNIIYGV